MPDRDSLLKLSFPIAGIDLSRAFSAQSPRQTEQGHGRTTPAGVNVRAFEPRTQRSRGGSRQGLSRYINALVSGANFIQDVALLTSSQGTSVQTSQSGRVVTLVAVSAGDVFAAPAGATAWSPATLGSGVSSPPFATTGVVLSAVNNQQLFMLNGTVYRRYDPSVNTLYNWTAADGTLPTDTAGNVGRLIETWRGRTVISGLPLDPQNWFMSAVSDPFDFNYSPVSPSFTQAVAGNNSLLGLIGEPVTGLVPFNDDVLVVGCDGSLWMFRGDPAAGGQIDRISDAIGMAWGRAWAKDPYGGIFFVSNRTGIYYLVPGQAPQRISQPIEQLLLDRDTGTYTFRLLWNDRFQGLHVFITKTAAAAATTHLFFEKRTGAWWQDSFTNNNHNPLCCCTFDGNLPNDRVPLIGSWDGYVRAFNPTATTDDGYAIASSVTLGPLVTEDMDDVLFKDIQGEFGETSGDVDYEVFVGQTAEQALSSDPVDSGTFSAGRNLTNHVRWAGHAIYVKLSSTNAWAMEKIKLRVASAGKVRRRGA